MDLYRRGRKRMDKIWQKYGFTPVNGKRKAMAFCIHCKNIFTNSSAKRMMRHRRICTAYSHDFSNSDKFPAKHRSSLDTTLKMELYAAKKSAGACSTDPLSTVMLNLLQTSEVDADCYVENLQKLFAASEEQLQLQEERAKVEAEYYRVKAAYFTKLAENAEIRRTVMELEAQKLKIEIDKFPK